MDQKNNASDLNLDKLDKDFFKIFKNQVKEFVGFIKRKKRLAVQVGLVMVLFCLLPTQNYYAKLNIPLGKPVVRSADLVLSDLPLYPVNITGQRPPWLTAFSYLVVDVTSKVIILAKNPDVKLFPASTTKIMTGLVALDYWQLDDVLSVKTVYNLGQIVGLEAGETISLENLLYGLLVQSGNDAAMALAENYPGGVEEFVKVMNQKAKDLNLLETNFVNPTGVEAYQHVTTAHDLAILASLAMDNQVFAKMVATPAITITDTSGLIENRLENINKLLGKVAGVKGVKTGWTENAGECLVAYTQRGDRKIITVVLNSQDRFSETEQLIEWVFANFNWEPTKSSPE